MSKTIKSTSAGIGLDQAAPKLKALKQMMQAESKSSISYTSIDGVLGNSAKELFGKIDITAPIPPDQLLESAKARQKNITMSKEQFLKTKTPEAYLDYMKKKGARAKSYIGKLVGSSNYVDGLMSSMSNKPSTNNTSSFSLVNNMQTVSKVCRESGLSDSLGRKLIGGNNTAVSTAVLSKFID